MTAEEKDRSLAKGLGQNLKYLREKKGMTQGQLAEKFEVRQSTIANWENGYREPGLYHLHCIHDFFEVDLDKLIFGKITPSLVVRNILFFQKKYSVNNRELGLLMRLKDEALKSFCRRGIEHFEYDVCHIARLAEYFGVTLDQLVMRDLSKEASR